MNLETVRPPNEMFLSISIATLLLVYMLSTFTVYSEMTIKNIEKHVIFINKLSKASIFIILATSFLSTFKYFNLAFILVNWNYIMILYPLISMLNSQIQNSLDRTTAIFISVSWIDMLYMEYLINTYSITNITLILILTLLLIMASIQIRYGIMYVLQKFVIDVGKDSSDDVV